MGFYFITIVIITLVQDGNFSKLLTLKMTNLTFKQLTGPACFFFYSYNFVLKDFMLTVYFYWLTVLLIAMYNVCILSGGLDSLRFQYFSRSWLDALEFWNNL